MQVPPDCSAAVRKALGQDAEILKFGHLGQKRMLEALAVVRLKHSLGENGDTDIRISRMGIFQFDGSQWNEVLDASKNITNAVGYIGIDYIDDSYQFHGYSLDVGFGVDLTDIGDGKSAFVIALSYLGSNGGLEGVATEIAWNDKVGRYQEFSANEEPGGFKSELKNPPHVNVAGRP